MQQVQFDATEAELSEDSFEKYYSDAGKDEKIPKYKAHQLRYRKTEYHTIHLTEGILSVQEILKAAKSYGTTLSVYLTAVYLCAIGKEMSERQKRKPVALMIPVNLRNFFPSESVRNFFGWIDIGYNFSTQSNELEDVIAFTARFFKEELTPERIAARMNGFMRMEKNPLMRILPLPVKLWGMQLGAMVSSANGTAVFSNIGKIVMPEECREYIDWFDFYTTTPKMEICACSFEDNLTVSFTSCYVESTVEKNFFRMLTEQGMEVRIISWNAEKGGQQDAILQKM